MEKLVSIIVPVYNVEKFLKRCLDSLINQTYSNIEIITVNDGSTDGSPTILAAYSQMDARVKIVNKINGGLSSARNEGMKHCNGDFVLFVDSDDFIREDTVQLMLDKAIDTNSDLIVSDMEYLYDDGNKSLASGGEFDVSSFKENEEMLYINNSACNKLFAKELLQDFEFPVGLWYEDLGSIPLLVAKAQQIAKVNEPLYIYYQRSGSLAHSANKKIFDIYKAIKLIEDKVGNAAKKMYILHGLDLTTLRIKDFDDESIIEEYLALNMKYLNDYYPNWQSDPFIKTYSIKKRIIFFLLKHKCYALVHKIYR